MAFRKLPCFFAKRAEYIPGLLFNDLIHKPESSDITGYLTNFEKKIAFNFEFAEKVFPVSFGIGSFKNAGEIFLYFFDNKKLISLNFP